MRNRAQGGETIKAGWEFWGERWKLATFVDCSRIAMLFLHLGTIHIWRPQIFLNFGPLFGPPCPHLVLIYSIVFTQPPLLQLLMMMPPPTPDDPLEDVFFQSTQSAIEAEEEQEPLRNKQSKRKRRRRPSVPAHHLGVSCLFKQILREGVMEYQQTATVLLQRRNFPTLCKGKYLLVLGHSN